MNKTLVAYRLYCWLNLVWYLLIGSMGVAGILLPRWADLEILSEQQASLLFSCGVILIASALFFGTSTVVLMRQPRSPRAHLAHYINICLGISTCVLAPFCIWLAIRWQEPEVKDHFNSVEFQL